MKIQVLYFAGLAEQLGRTEQFLEVSEGITVGEVVRDMKEGWQDAKIDSLPLFKAVNEEYCEDKTILQSGDRLALLPPVAGG